MLLIFNFLFLFVVENKNALFFCNSLKKKLNLLKNVAIFESCMSVYNVTWGKTKYDDFLRIFISLKIKTTLEECLHDEISRAPFVG